MAQSAQQGEQPTPIAIVGMSCRLPGDVSTLEEFWRLMSRARSGWSEIPKDRFSKDAYWHPNPEKKGCFNTSGGYFLNQDLACFDAPFFNITAQEAQSLDPQQRILLECSYEALENSGIPKEAIIGKNIGVFVGGAASDYRLGNLRDADYTPMFDATGNHQSILSNRISYYFDLRGPSFTVDTACSSSLYALHQAVQSIRSGESEQAIVAACHINLLPDDFVSMSMSRLFSEEGKTYAFDHRAKSGFARGEGAGCLVLKPLDQALRDNDRVRAVIVNTGVNQDGRTVGLSSPNGEAQERLMREVYANANISPEDTGFVEAHGTGTKVGDPIEATALYNVFGKGRTARQPLYFGSVKTNVGHLENASGVVSVIKAAMMLEKGFILPNINFEKPNEAIPMAKWNMKVPTSQRPWPMAKRFISINNFGFGGSNAHAVLERPPFPPKSALIKESADPTQKLFVLSANDEESAKKSMDNLGIFLEQHPEVFQKSLTRNIAYTLSKRRSHLPWRIALIASSSNELAIALNSHDAKPTRCSQPPKVAFIFTGQGAQWHAMGRELLDAYPAFGNTIKAADECLKNIGSDFSLLEELSRDKESSQVGKAHISQPICTAVQLALTDLLKSWGVQPASVTGHSSGEIGAAYAAGLLTLESAMAIAYHRGQAVIKLKEKHPDLKGTMLAVGASPEEVRPMLKMLRNGQAVVACENSPNSITASGDAEAIDELAAAIEQKQQFNRKLRVDVAYHSPHMSLVADDYRAAIQDVKPLPDQTATFYSSLHGRKVEGSSLDVSYWVENLTNPVLFSTSLRELCTDSTPDILVEVGPHAALEGPIKQTVKELGKQASKITYLGSLIRNKDAIITCLELAGKLWMKGQPVDFDNINWPKEDIKTPTFLAEMPPYPWSHQTRYWSESRINQGHRIKKFPRHDLLGRIADYSNELEPTWKNVIRTDDLPWLRDHKMQELTTFPFAGFICMAIEAASQRAEMREVSFDRFSLREIQVSRPLLLEDGVDYETTFTLRPYAEGTRSYSDSWDEFRVCSWDETKGWTEHCRGLVGVRKGDASNPVSEQRHGRAAERLQDAKARCKTPVDTSRFYNHLNAAGAMYGPAFQNVVDLNAGDDKAHAVVTVPDTASHMPYQYETPSVVHTAFMDLIFQLSFTILGAGRFGMKTLYMPSAIKEVHVLRTVPNQPGERLHVVASGFPDFISPKPTDFSMDGLFSPDAKEASITFEGLTLSPIKGDSSVMDGPRELCYKLQWEPVEQGPTSSSTLEVPNGVNGASGHRKLNSIGSLNGVSLNGVTLNGVNGVNGHRRGHSNGVNGHSRNHSHSNGVNGTNGVHEIEGDISSPPVVIVAENPESNSLVTSLTDAITIRTGQAPSVCRLADVYPVDKVCIVLSELDGHILSKATPETFAQVQKVLTTSAGALWVTRGAYKSSTNPDANMAVGLIRSVRSETAAKAATLDLDPYSPYGTSAQVELIMKAFKRTMVEEEGAADADMEYAEEGGKLVVPRVVEDLDLNLFIHRETQQSAAYLQDFKQGNRRLRLAIETAGALDTLFFEDETEKPLGDDEIEIQIAATGMNFKDVVIAMGQLPNPYLGIECSGTVSKIGCNVSSLSVGDRVCAMPEGAYGTYTRCLATSAAKLPQDMSFEIAASIPVVYCTAYYALVDLGRLAKGERILIHAGAGGVGQACIQLAQMIGADIYTTVGSPDKKKLLMDAYNVPEDRIFYSRDTSFGPAIRAATDGEGVDVVVNSLAGDFLRETWDCLAHFGRFIEIGKRDITSNTRLEMAKFAHNATFSSIDLTVVANERPRLLARIFEAVMKLLDFGVVQPIRPINVLGISQLESAFRSLQSGKTTGKLIIVPKPGEQVKATHLRANNLFRPDASYVIIGGTGGLGRSMAKWMVLKGARSIVLLSRSGKTDGKVGQLIEDVRPMGATITVKACDVADAPSVQALVQECSRTLPPIRGVIHAAMVLRDVLFEKMTFEEYDTVYQSKVTGAWNMHHALGSTPLDFFVALSSVAGIVGNRGQAAYAAANTFLDAFVQHRLRQGLPATSIDLTAIEGVGYLAEADPSRHMEVLQNIGGDTLNEAEVLALLAAAVSGATARSCASHCLTGLKLPTEPGSNLPFYASDAKFTHLREAALAASNAEAPADAKLGVAQALRLAHTPDEALEVVSNGLLEKLSAILMVPVEDMDAARGVTTYGLDSLNAIELRNWITRELQANLQVLELLTSGSLRNLAQGVLKKTKIECPMAPMSPV